MRDASDTIKESNEKLSRAALVFPILAAFFVVAAWFATLIALKDVQHRGTFGDMFGTVNALFSGLAFVGVVTAIILQSKELQLQRKELKDTRQELKGQKLQMATQNETLRKQNFENTFFELLRLQNSIVNSIDLVDQSNRITSGRDCFEVFFTRFSKLWGRNQVPLRGNSETERIENTYARFFADHESELGHYFRTLYNIIKFIDNSPIEEKKLYTNLVRAQLSSFELLLLFYNSLSNLGREKFKPLIEKYALLKTLPQIRLLGGPDHIPLYDKEAYGL